MPKFPWPIVSEERIIRHLYNQVEAFRTFYDGERSKISPMIYWAQDRTLPNGIDFRSTTIEEHGIVVKCIRLRHLPPELSDALSIAHEIEHFVLAEEGFPVTGAAPQYESLSAALNTMLQDPLVNARLQNYGFWLRADYELEKEVSFRHLETSAGPSNRLTAILWVFNYVADLLDWALVKEPTEDKSRIQAFMESRYPDIACEGQRLFSTIQNIGIETPMQHSRVFQHVLTSYNLLPFITL